MAVVPMERLYLCALKQDRKQILELLQRLNVVEIRDFLDEDPVFSRTKTDEQRSSFDRSISTLTKALEVLEDHFPSKESMFASLAGRDVLTEDDYSDLVQNTEKIMGTARKLISWDKTVSEASASIVKLESKKEALAPWLSLPVPLSFGGTRSTAALIGSLPGEWTMEQIAAETAAADGELGPMDIQIVSRTADLTTVMVLCMKGDADACEEALRSIGFTRPSLQARQIPEEYNRKLQKGIDEAEKEKADTLERIGACVEDRDSLRYLMDYFTMRREKYEVIDHLLQSKNTFVLTGYVPATESEGIRQQLEARFALAAEVVPVSEDEAAPVLLHNNGFAEPVEGVLESFSLPGKNEIDPSGIMAFFYYLLFGLMLSDFAYGAMLSLGAWFLLKKFPNMEKGLRKNVKMFGYCGITTMFWGIMFSSYFGNIVDTVSSTFFGVTLSIPPLWFVPLDNPMRMMVFCMAVGVIHLYTGLAMQMYQLCRQKRYWDAFCDVGLWYLLVTSLIGVLLSMEMFAGIFQLSFTLPSSVTTACGIIAGAAALGIILTAGRDSRNWFKRILKGAYGLYNVTSYLSDILSYSRLLALGLATGVIASVINQMGSMMGGGIVGAIVFILVFIIGHSINLGINALGAYVHTNRLQFVEFFGKFYEGGGTPFKPFGIHTKFFKFKEDKHNG